MIPLTRLGLLIVAIAAAIIGITPPVAAQDTVDPHAVYEGRCARCHQPHASDLAKAALTLQNGVVVMRSSGAPLDLFLDQHPHGLPRAEAQALLKQFRSMLETGFLYQDKCVACHDRASTLARLRLFERDGVLEGRYTHRDISEFLRNHGRLSAQEVDIIMGMFHRQLSPSAPR